MDYLDPAGSFSIHQPLSVGDQEMENMMRYQLFKSDKNEGNSLSLPSRRAWVMWAMAQGNSKIPPVLKTLGFKSCPLS